MSIDEYPQGSGYEPRLVNSGARPSNPFPGMEIYELDTGRKHVWNGTAWDPLTVRPYGKYTATGVGSHNGTAFLDVPGPIDLVFAKQATQTALHVVGSMTHYCSGTGLSAHGLLINGVDYSIGDFFFNTPSEHTSIGFGGMIAAGLAAGTYTARLRWRIVHSLVTINCDNNDVALFSIQEFRL
jgi:hypothetical protein